MGIKTHLKNRIRRLVGTHELNRRQQAIETSIENLSAAWNGGQSEKTRTLEELLQRQEAALWQAYTVATLNTVKQASEDAFFRTGLNDVEVDLPRDTIRRYVPCLHGKPEGPLILYVETAHLKWMMSHIEDGGSFLEIGASVGAITIPMALTFGAGAKVVAFEPARGSRRLLELTLERNGLCDVVGVIPHAVSNKVGKVAFSEYAYDEACGTSWLPDCSAIHSALIDDSRTETYEVEVTTLDAFCSAHGLLDRPAVVKIDVEGFEVLVLEGALALIQTARPWFSIDIHRDPFGDGSTEEKVRVLLGHHGYHFERMGHVLLASPRE